MCLRKVCSIKETAWITVGRKIFMFIEFKTISDLEVKNSKLKQQNYLCAKERLKSA